MSGFGRPSITDSLSPPRSASRLASNRNQQRFSASSMKTSSRLAVATSSCSSTSLWASRMCSICALLSFISSRSMSSGGDVVLVVVLDPLQPGDMADRPDGGAADLAHPLGQDVDAVLELLGLLVEQQMVVAEMRPADMPMEILGLRHRAQRYRPAAR